MRFGKHAGAARRRRHAAPVPAAHAIASEHLPDDVTAIPQTVHAMMPGYEVICGRCNTTDRQLLAKVLWFK